MDRLLIVSLGILLGNSPSRAAVARIDLQGVIDPITAEYVIRGIERAEKENARLFLIRMNTPGGFASSMEEIITKILNSSVPVAVYVTPSGSKAASAGFFILLAADVAAMAPGTNTGAAHPLMAIGGIPIDGGEGAKTLTQKITSNATAFLRSIASKRNRNIEEAEKGVVESKSFTEKEAIEKNLIDLVARDEAELLRKLNGYKARLFSGSEQVLKTEGEAVVDYPMTARQKFLSTIAQPNLALLLGVAGLILLYFEFSNPGFVAPGVIGGISVLLSILGFSFLPINLVGVLMILLAAGLFIAEVKVQSFGVLGIGGVIAMVIGCVILIDAPDPAVRIGLRSAILTSVPFAVISTVLLISVVRSWKDRVTTGEVGMVGLIGVTDSEVFTAGRVRVHGEYWKAHSDSQIAAGTRVRVTRIDNLDLTVEEVSE